MTFLVDANVLSEPTKSAPDGKVVEWLTANERSLVRRFDRSRRIECRRSTLPRGRKRDNLERWHEVLVQAIDCRPWDVAISRRWVVLVVELKFE